MVRGTPRKQLAFEFEVKPELLLSPDEIFERADAELLVRLGEDRRIERKPSSYSGSSFGEYVSMWANTSPDGGLLVSGMEDGGGFEGCMRLSQSALNNLEKAAHNFCPDARTSSKRVAVANKNGQPDFVLLTRVKYHPDVVVKTCAGEAFVRKGDSKYKLSPDEVRELQADKGEVSFEQQDSGIPYPEGFDSNAVSQFVARVRKARELSDALTEAEVLDVRHLGRFEAGTFRPNIACALLFALDPLRLIPGCRVRFQKFEGETEQTGDKYNAVKDLFLEGRVPELIQRSEELLEQHLRTFSPLDAKGKFFPVQEYPKLAWYEVIVNACVHRSYGNGMKNMPIFIKLFDDRLVIESPGPFPPFVTPQNIYSMHQPRNPKLMDALFYLDYVKCAHEGTRRIRDSMAENKLPEPEFMQQSEIGHSVVRVTLRNNIRQRRVWIDQDVSRIVSEAIAADLTEDEKRVLNWAAEHGSITVSDANKLLDISWQRARRLLLQLVDRRVFQYIRFRENKRDVRDPKAFFRLRSQKPIPDGAFEATGDDS